MLWPCSQKYELDDCPVPTFVAGARSKQVTNSYVKLNKAVKTAVKGNLTFYVNTDEELLQVVSSSDTSASLKETFLEAWVQVLSKNYRFNNYKHTWYMGGTPEKYGTYELEPYIMPEEWGITRRVMETNLLGTGTFLWYEFHPEATLKAPIVTIPATASAFRAMALFTKVAGARSKQVTNSYVKLIRLLRLQ